MKIIMIVPRVVQSFISQFPESSQNAYKYFNFDHRVVEERVQRGSGQAPNERPLYQGPYDLTNADYSALVTTAKTMVNPILKKYSSRVANEDALNLAIRDFNNGQFDGKINASHFNVLLQAMDAQPVMAKKKEKTKPSKKETIAPRRLLRQLGIDPHKVPQRSQLKRRIQKGVPYLLRQPGAPGSGIVLKGAESTPKEEK